MTIRAMRAGVSCICGASYDAPPDDPIRDVSPLS